MASRKKAARSGAKTTRKGKAGAATKRAVSKPAGKPARPGRKAVKVAAKAMAGKATRKATKKATGKTTRKTAAPRTAAASSTSGFPEISDLAELMEQHGLVEVEYERAADGMTRIHVKRAGAPAAASISAAPAPAQAASPVAPAAVEAPPAPAMADDLHAFKSPMVGTFYRAPSPEASSFASVGDTVDVSNTVCIIEAMKVMNEITPDISGEVVSIEVENGEAVEFGQTLMLIRTR